MDIALVVMLGAIVVGSVLSLLGGIALIGLKKRRRQALLLTMPFGAGALLAAAFFDLLPEALTGSDVRSLLLYCLGGFLTFFLLERLAGWFHAHHEHDGEREIAQQRWLVMAGDLIHNIIDGIAIGVAFLVSIPTGIIATLAVAAHEIPKELGTFAILLSKGWRGRIVVFANLVTTIGTIIAATIVYSVGSDMQTVVPPLLAITSGFFIYIAASDIIPDIHERPQKEGTVQAGMLLVGVIVVGGLINVLHATGLHSHTHDHNPSSHLEESAEEPARHHEAEERHDHDRHGHDEHAH